MPFADVGDLRMYVEMQGQGPRLLAISGTGGDLRRAGNVGPLAQQFTLLQYDQRGLGRTTIPDPPYTMEDYADDAAALLDTLEWDHCAVMGTSFGGMVAQVLALRHPQRVDRLVLNCTSSGGAGRASYPLHTLDGLSPEDRFDHLLPISDTRRDQAWQDAHPDQVEALRLEALANAAVSAKEPRRAIGATAQLKARAQLDAYDRLPELRMPVLVCGGRFDGIAPPANQDALCRQIPQAELAMFDGGHPFLRQDPAALPRIAAFLLAQSAS
jgi:3-oxoadipate enol-lactonase